MMYATLSNESNYTVFKYNKHIIRFKAPYSLEHYSAVKEWDHGYIVVMAKHRRYQSSGACSRKAVYRRRFIGRMPDSSRLGLERSMGA